ncbi:MAG: HK97 gp10 family phage protein, partial [Bacillus sp. (in: firmicutes)]
VTKIEGLAAEITKQLQTYTTEVEKKVKRAENKATTQAVNELKQTSPKNKGGYAGGWAKKKTDEGIVIYNKNKPGLTHLLEKGHAKVSGGRVEGTPHIRPAEQKAIREFEKAVEKAIKS